jgi:hypothetical protein
LIWSHAFWLHQPWYYWILIVDNPCLKLQESRGYYTWMPETYSAPSLYA